MKELLSKFKKWVTVARLSKLEEMSSRLTLTGPKDVINQRQSVGDGSTAIQVAGDYHATPYTEVRAIFEDLLELNFPRIQSAAEIAAKSNFAELLEELRHAIEKRHDQIDKTKLQDPDIQYQIQELVVYAARKGSKSNPELLCELLAEVLSSNTSELFDLVAEDARRALPRLAKRHIALLAFSCFSEDLEITATDPDGLSHALEDVIPHLESASDNTLDDLRYLYSLGVASERGIVHVGLIPRCIQSQGELSGKNVEQLREICKEHGESLANISRLLDLTDACLLGRFLNTSTGKLIGCIYFSRISRLDIRGIFG